MAAGRGSRMCRGRLSSSSISSIDFCRITMLLMVLMVLVAELVCDVKDARSVLLAREDGDDDRRNDVRMLCGEKRAVMDWKRDECMLPSTCFWGWTGFLCLSGVV